MNARRAIRWLCFGVIVLSVFSCIIMAIARSNGLIAITVTAIDPRKEPHDLKVPLMAKNDALPDYELTLLDDSGRSRYLGVKPNESAAKGLTWTLDDPVSLSQIASLRLQEKDVAISDQLAEVQIVGSSVKSNNYQFDFQTGYFFGIGVVVFFQTPIGIAISIAFGIAVLHLILGNRL